MLTHPGSSGDADECRRWVAERRSRSYAFAVLEIADYELRRGYLHRRSHKALANLDTLVQLTRCLAIDTFAMRRAAELWALARQSGTPTAGERALDVDIILAAQALTLEADDDTDVIVATTNVRHLGLFTDAREWGDI